MAMTLKEVEAEARKLTREDQIELAGRLLEGDAGGVKIDPELLDTCRRRLREMKEGKVRGVDGDQMLARARSLLNETV